MKTPEVPGGSFESLRNGLIFKFQSHPQDLPEKGTLKVWYQLERSQKI